MFELIFLVAVSLYFLQLVFFIVGTSKKYSVLSEDKLPSVSVIVAARNEEKNILRCIKSLDRLEYPKDKIEVIIINDNSTDKTGEIIEEFINGKSLFTSITPSKEFGELKGKANAIANGIEIAKNEIIITTDADCIVSKTWAKALAKYYTKNVAVVCGFTNQFSSSVFSGMQAIDFIYLLTVGSGATNLKMPISAMGNNMSYRKDVYQEVGGYSEINFSVTEDFSLLKAIEKLSKYKIIFPSEKDAVINSAPCENLSTLYWQKKRWSVGGLKSDLFGFWVALIAFFGNLSFLSAPFFLSSQVFYLMFFKVCADFAFLKFIHVKLNLPMKLRNFIGFQIYFLIYVLIMPPLAFFNKKVKWKEREY